LLPSHTLLWWGGLAVAPINTHLTAEEVRVEDLSTTTVTHPTVQPWLGNPHAPQTVAGHWWRNATQAAFVNAEGN